VQEPIHDLAAAYALDALDDSERSEFEEHLRDCERCSGEIEQLRETAAALAYVAEGPPPPAALRDRLIERAREEGPSNVVPLRRRRWPLAVAATVAVAASAAAIVLGLWASSLSNSLDEKKAALEIVGDPAAKRVALGRRSQVAVLPNGKAALISTMQPAPNGKTYELWVIDRGGAKPAGLFRAGQSGKPVLLARGVPKGAQIGLSLEHAGGAPDDRPTLILAVSRRV
jgi:anti-sigma factor RsiW